MAQHTDSQKFASLREHEERRINETVGLRVANHRMIAYLMNISIAVCLGYAFRGDITLLSVLEIIALLVVMLVGAAPCAIFFFTERPKEYVEFFEMHLGMEHKMIEAARYLAVCVHRQASEKNLKLARRWRKMCLVMWGIAMVVAILLIGINAAMG